MCYSAPITTMCNHDFSGFIFIPARLCFERGFAFRHFPEEVRFDETVMFEHPPSRFRPYSFWPPLASAQSVTILGGGLKGQPYQFAVGLSKILKSKAGISCHAAIGSKGMVAQARIIAKGQAQFAWGLGGPVGAWAYKGERRFKKEGPKKNLRAVLAISLRAVPVARPWRIQAS